MPSMNSPTPFVLMPEVEECHLIAGNFDYLIKARVRDMTDYRDFSGRQPDAATGGAGKYQLPRDGGSAHREH